MNKVVALVAILLSFLPSPAQAQQIDLGDACAEKESHAEMRASGDGDGVILVFRIGNDRLTIRCPKPVPPSPPPPPQDMVIDLGERCPGAGAATTVPSMVSVKVGNKIVVIRCPDLHVAPQVSPAPSFVGPRIYTWP